MLVIVKTVYSIIIYETFPIVSISFVNDILMNVNQILSLVQLLAIGILPRR